MTFPRPAPPTPVPAALSHRALLGLLLACALLRGVAWATVVPPLHPNDEAQHVLRVRGAAGDLPVNPPTATDPPTVPLDLARLGGRVGLGTVERDRDLKIDLAAPTDPDAPATSADGSPAAPRRVGVPDRAEGVGLVRHAAFDDQHPPLFYWLTAVVYQPLRPLGVGGQLLAMRFVAALTGVGVAWAAWAIGRSLWPGRPGRALVLGSLVALQPTAGFYASVVNNESLAILLFTLALLLLVRATRRPLGWADAAGLAAVGGAGLLTKATFLAVAPAYAAVAVWQAVAFDRPARTLGRWAAVALACAAASAPWYVPAMLDARETALAVVRSSGKPVPPLGLLEHLGGEELAEQFERVVKGEYWGSSLGNGWNRADPAIPTRARLATMAVALAGSLATGAWVLWRAAALRGRSLHPFAAGAGPGLAVLGLANLSLAAFLVALDFRFAQTTGSGFRLRGQYLMPAVAGAMAWVAFGVGLLRPPTVRAVALFALVAGAAATNAYTLVAVVGPRYYGVGPTDLPSAVAAVQPAGAWFAGGVLVLWSASIAALLVAVGRALWLDEASAVPAGEVAPTPTLGPARPNPDRPNPDRPAARRDRAEPASHPLPG